MNHENDNFSRWSLSRQIVRADGEINFQYLDGTEVRGVWLRLRQLATIPIVMPGRPDNSLERCTSKSEQSRVFEVQQQREAMRLANHRQWSTFWRNIQHRWVMTMLDILVVTGQVGLLLHEIERYRITSPICIFYLHG
jgi:hypothetical protein